MARVSAVSPEGFEPSRPKAADFKSAAYADSAKVTYISNVIVKDLS